MGNRVYEEKVSAVQWSGMRPVYYKAMIADACRTLHVNREGIRLLQYYGSCAQGFTPALAQIEKNTDIAKNKVSETRKYLQEHSLIFYSRIKRTVTILWEHIRAFALVPQEVAKRMTRKSCLHPESFPSQQEERERLTLGRLQKMIQHEFPTFQTLKQAKRNPFLGYLESLTEGEELTLLRSFPEGSSIPDPYVSSENLIDKIKEEKREEEAILRPQQYREFFGGIEEYPDLLVS